eukprot:GHVT01067816.1.p1 GENE.GHVT01067816.1~~GHVT01067816.1.p1  ORF type:complete len:712 (-),score=47.81 GHVT01067816.1:1374-3509(-)
MTMLQSAYGFIKRHKWKLITGSAALGVGVYIGRKVFRRMALVSEILHPGEHHGVADSCLIGTKEWYLARHFPRHQKVADCTVQRSLPGSKSLLSSHFNVELYIRQLWNRSISRTVEERELSFNNMKLAVVGRTLTAVYWLVIIMLQNRVQINMIARDMVQRRVPQTRGEGVGHNSSPQVRGKYNEQDACGPQPALSEKWRDHVGPWDSSRSDPNTLNQHNPLNSETEAAGHFSHRRKEPSSAVLRTLDHSPKDRAQKSSENNGGSSAAGSTNQAQIICRDSADPSFEVAWNSAAVVRLPNKITDKQDESRCGESICKEEHVHANELERTSTLNSEAMHREDFVFLSLAQNLANTATGLAEVSTAVAQATSEIIGSVPAQQRISLSQLRAFIWSIFDRTHDLLLSGGTECQDKRLQPNAARFTAVHHTGGAVSPIDLIEPRQKLAAFSSGSAFGIPQVDVAAGGHQPKTASQKSASLQLSKALVAHLACDSESHSTIPKRKNRNREDFDVVKSVDMQHTYNCAAELMPMKNTGDENEPHQELGPGDRKSSFCQEGSLVWLLLPEYLDDDAAHHLSNVDALDRLQRRLSEARDWIESSSFVLLVRLALDTCTDLIVQCVADKGVQQGWINESSSSCKFSSLNDSVGNPLQYDPTLLTNFECPYPSDSSKDGMGVITPNHPFARQEAWLKRDPFSACLLKKNYYVFNIVACSMF